MDLELVACGLDCVLVTVQVKSKRIGIVESGERVSVSVES